MFDVRFRDEMREFVLDLARADERVSAGAVVGSLAVSEGDRWSDLDLTFAVRYGEPTAVLDDWGRALRDAYAADALFDLRSGPSLYRVFLLPGGLQVDLSVTPEAEFGPQGRRFRLLFGGQPRGDPTPGALRPQSEIAGYAAHHALRARVSIERGKPLQGEYWINCLRDEVRALACERRGLWSWQAREADRLPAKVTRSLLASLPASHDVVELRRALSAGIDLLLAEASLEPSLRQKLVEVRG